MAGLIKELLLDYSLNRLSVDTRSDLTIAIQHALTSGAFKIRDITMLNLYLSGYTAKDIAAMTVTLSEPEIEAILERIFIAIEYTSGYTDEGLVHKLELTKRYRKSNLSKLELFLQDHGKHYTFHDLER